MESKYRLKPSYFLTPHRRDTTVYCPACGCAMNLIPNTPKEQKLIYQCPRCNTIIPRQYFKLSDLK
ncbi:MAG: hypothetical protein ACTSQU_03980 [Promethearchaeota archaeon]